MPKNKLNIIKDEVDPTPIDLIEKAILDIAQGMRVLNSSRLTRNALLALIKDHSGLPKSTIAVVLNNLDELEKLYLKPKGEKK